MHSAVERVNFSLFSLLVLAFGILCLNQYLNHLNQPAIALSMFVTGAVAFTLRADVNAIDSAK